MYSRIIYRERKSRNQTKLISTHDPSFGPKFFCDYPGITRVRYQTPLTHESFIRDETQISESMMR